MKYRAIAPDNGRNSGFTLLEMMVVMAIFAVLIASLFNRVPSHGGRLTLMQTASDIAGLLRSAHSNAILYDRFETVQFDTRQGLYGASLQNPNHVPPSVVMSSSAPAPVFHIRFAPDGTATPQAIVLRQQNRHLVIRTTWLSGHVDISADD